MPLATLEKLDIETQQQIGNRADNTILQLDLPLLHKGNDKAILIVDDDHVNIKVLVDALIQKAIPLLGR